MMKLVPGVPIRQDYIKFWKSSSTTHAYINLSDGFHLETLDLLFNSSKFNNLPQLQKAKY